MIQLTRLNGDVFALNSALIYRIEQYKDTIVFLTDGNDFIVAESMEEIIGRIRRSQSEVLADAIVMATLEPVGPEPDGPAGPHGDLEGDGDLEVERDVRGGDTQ